MANFSVGSVVSGGTFIATDATPNVADKGCIFTSCTFVNPSRFGEGCIFVECTFLDYYDKTHTQPHRTGTANVFTDCTFNYVVFGADNVSNRPISGGTRPNVSGDNMETSHKSSSCPAKSITACPVCGNYMIYHNGEVLESGNIIRPEQEIKGGNVESSGVCPKCST